MILSQFLKKAWQLLPLHFWEPQLLCKKYGSPARDTVWWDPCVENIQRSGNTDTTGGEPTNPNERENGSPRHMSPGEPFWATYTSETWEWKVQLDTITYPSLVPSWGMMKGWLLWAIKGTSPVAQRLGLCTLTAKGLGSIPGRGANIPQAVWHSQNKTKKGC